MYATRTYFVIVGLYCLIVSRKIYIRKCQSLLQFKNAINKYYNDNLI